MASNGRIPQFRDTKIDAVPEQGSHGLESPTESRVGIGAYLTQQRRLRGITLEELHELTLIPARSLTRLEEGEFDHDDDGFARGFVRTVAEALGLNTDDAISRMSEEPAPQEGFQSDSVSSLGRLVVIFLCLLAVLLSAGLVSVVAQWVPNLTEPVVTVLRRDPVRQLAEARESSEFSGVRVWIDPGSDGAAEGIRASGAVPMRSPLGVSGAEKARLRADSKLFSDSARVPLRPQARNSQP